MTFLQARPTICIPFRRRRWKIKLKNEKVNLDRILLKTRNKDRYTLNIRSLKKEKTLKELTLPA